MPFGFQGGGGERVPRGGRTCTHWQCSGERLLKGGKEKDTDRKETKESKQRDREDEVDEKFKEMMGKIVRTEVRKQLSQELAGMKKDEPSQASSS